MEDEELSVCAPDAPGPKGTSIDLTVDKGALRLSGLVAMASISKEVIAEIKADAASVPQKRMRMRSDK
mgnify:CR=1 FL=1